MFFFVFAVCFLFLPSVAPEVLDGNSVDIATFNEIQVYFGEWFYVKFTGFSMNDATETADYFNRNFAPLFAEDTFFSVTAPDDSSHTANGVQEAMAAFNLMAAKVKRQISVFNVNKIESGPNWATVNLTAYESSLILGLDGITFESKTMEKLDVYLVRQQGHSNQKVFGWQMKTLNNIKLTSHHYDRNLNPYKKDAIIFQSVLQDE
jgi:hypothetical protein